MGGPGQRPTGSVLLFATWGAATMLRASPEGTYSMTASPRGLRATLFRSPPRKGTHQLRECGELGASSCQGQAWPHSSRVTPRVLSREVRQRQVTPPTCRVLWSCPLDRHITAMGPAAAAGCLLFSPRSCDFSRKLHSQLHRSTCFPRRVETRRGWSKRAGSKRGLRAGSLSMARRPDSLMLSPDDLGEGAGGGGALASGGPGPDSKEAVVSKEEEGGDNDREGC